MSGPKIAGWSVEQNIEREKRIVEELHNQARVLNARFQDIASRWCEAKQKYGKGFPKFSHSIFELPTSAATRNQLQEFISVWQNNLSQVQDEYEREISIAAMRNMFSEITVVPSKSDMGDGSDNPTNDIKHVNTNAHISRLSEVSKILEVLVPGVSCIDRNCIEELAKEMVGVTSISRFESLKIEIYLRIQRVNEKTSALERESKKVAELRSRLIGLDGEEVRRLMNELNQIERRELPLRDNFIEEFESVVLQATQESDRLYASNVIFDELKNLGYMVDEGFETIFVEGGEVKLRKAELAEYRVVLNVKPELEKMDVCLARQSSSVTSETQVQRLRDRYMEEAWCKDLAKVFSASCERGINARVVERLRAGTKAVPIIIEKIVSERSHRSSSPLRCKSRSIDS